MLRNNNMSSEKNSIFLTLYRIFRTTRRIEIL